MPRCQASSQLKSHVNNPDRGKSHGNNENYENIGKRKSVKKMHTSDETHTNMVMHNQAPITWNNRFMVRIYSLFFWLLLQSSAVEKTSMFAFYHSLLSPFYGSSFILFLAV